MRTLPLLLVILVATPLQAKERVDYLRDVKPLLELKCYACHGALEQKSKLRLDTASLIKKGGRNGPAIVPGNAKASLLLAKVIGKEETLMPPEGLGERLNDEQIDVLRRWIEAGATAPDEPIPPDPREHWAYRPPTKADFDPKANPIDSFLDSQHRAQGLTPVGLADKATLLRRVYLDVIGLPPTRSQLHAFLQDDSEGAYGKVVDTLLDSPHHGERWGRHWMDVWRYSDWSGYKAQLRNSQRHIWHWRDWIVESLNADKGYDRMIVEMLAADELAPTDRDALRATGFLARHYYKFNRHFWMDTAVEHTFKAFLGTTINCAKCHDHKYDPLPQVNYYQLRAIFEPYNVRIEPIPGQLDPVKGGIPRIYDADASTKTYLFERGSEKHPKKDKPLSPKVPEVFGAGLPIASVKLPTYAYYPSLQAFVVEQKLAEARKQVQSETAKAKKERAKSPKLADARTRSANATLAALQARIDAERAKYANPPDKRFADLAKRASQAEREANLHRATVTLLEKTDAVASVRKPKPDAKSKAALAKAEKELADAKKKHQAAESAAKKSDGKYTPLGTVYPSTSTGRRLALAKWIAHRENPLTARVAVNHVWLRHFGTPLVDNVFDFGLRSDRPRHGALLDWLAVDFMEHGWSFKHLHRTILASQAYRRSSSSKGANPSNLAKDPDNHHLWRMNPLRMEAEIVRDSVLAVAGSLDPKRGGPDLAYAQGLTVARRSIYFQHAYEKKVKFLELFDGANEEDCYRRTISVIPQQALALANSPLSIEQSRILAGKLAAQSAKSDEPEVRFVVLAFETVLSRSPTAKELAVCRSFLDEQATRLASKSLTAIGGSVATRVAASGDPQQRARENLVHVLFNHNDFVTIR